jgi:release factor glutamine methyltransferase
VEEGTVAWRELLAAAERTLADGGAATAAIDARRIVEEAAGVEPSEFRAVLDEPATVRGVARLDAMVARRAAGEPLQYVVGRWGFRSLDLAVDRRALIPRPETEVVAGLAIAEVERIAAAVEHAGGHREVLVVDLGTGSGAIALAVATECPRARVLAVDVAPDALALARANLAGIGRAATRVSLHEGSWFDALPSAVVGSVDVIVANPPYVADDEELPPVVDDWEPTGALRAGPRGLDDLVCIVDGADRWLTPDGVVVLEMAPHQTARIADRLATSGFTASIHRDLAGRDRAVVGRR